MGYNSEVMNHDTISEMHGTAEVLQWSVSVTDEEVVVVLDGELDLVDAEALTEFLQQAVEDEPPARVVVDLARLSFLDSSGIRCFIHAARSASKVGSKFTLRHPVGRVLRVLQLCGVDEFLLDDTHGDASEDR